MITVPLAVLIFLPGSPAGLGTFCPESPGRTTDWQMRFKVSKTLDFLTLWSCFRGVSSIWTAAILKGRPENFRGTQATRQYSRKVSRAVLDRQKMFLPVPW